jgi:imidazolonepropionase-like amidohydrolase
MTGKNSRSFASLRMTGTVCHAVLACGLVAAFASPAVAQTRAIRFGKLVDGTGRVVTDAVVIVDGDKVTRVATGDRGVPAGATVIDLRKYTGIPGMIDAHTHMTYYWDQRAGTTPWNQGGGRTADQTLALLPENARKTLETGVTTVRDLGASNRIDIRFRDQIDRGEVVGPRMIVSGVGLSRRRVTDIAQIAELVKGQVDAGANVIKMYGSTGSAADVTGRQTFTVEEMKAAVDAARAHGKRIAIHSYGPDGGRDAVRAGATSVEHAIDLDDETLREMARRGVFYVPTIDHNRYYAEYRDQYQYTAAQVAALDSFRLLNIETARRAFKAGVKLGMGSDAVFTGFGENTRELGWFVKIGMTPAQALATATTNGAAMLGMEKSLGAVAPGYFADIVAVEGDPLANIDVVINNVRWVMKGGAVVVDKTKPPAQGQVRVALSTSVRQYVRYDSSLIALTHVRVIDGTGAAARDDQTLLLRDGTIASMGNASAVAIPAGAQVIDLAGKSVLPGLVMLHEHLYYPSGGGTYGNLSESFTRLYLAGGVTSMRTGGNTNGYGELNIKTAIDRGQKPGPWLDVTAPYLEGPNAIGQMYALKDAADARRFVNFWADAGATSFKSYMNITRDQLAAATDEVHKRGLRITGHLCSVTYREAAGLGIDNLEHGFFAATDFVAEKRPDACPGQAVGQRTVAALDTASADFRSLVAELVQRRVALTSTLTVFETFVGGRPLPPGLDVLEPQLKESFERRHAQMASGAPSSYATLVPRARAMEVAFVRAGGLLVVGTDPTGGGGVIPGFSNQRALELLVESGFTPLEAIKIGTMNGALYLNRSDRIGTIAVGKQADLVVLTGDPSRRIEDVRNVELVFKQGYGFDPARLIASVKGKVGLW